MEYIAQAMASFAQATALLCITMLVLSVGFIMKGTIGKL